jgi:hypothetical protein
MGEFEGDEEVDDTRYIVGFDCGHAYDIIPSFVASGIYSRQSALKEQYRNIAYVKKEIECLARQLNCKEFLESLPES